MFVNPPDCLPDFSHLVACNGTLAGTWRQTLRRKEIGLQSSGNTLTDFLQVAGNDLQNRSRNPT